MDKYNYNLSSSEDIKHMSMIYKILNSIIISLETGRFIEIKPALLEKYKQE